MDKDIELDLAMLDKNRQMFLIAEVKRNKQTFRDFEAMESSAASLEQLGHSVAFAVLADPEMINIFEWKGENLQGPIAALNTRSVLSEYEPEFGKRTVYEAYLLTLLESWLRDMAYHWKSDTPPGVDDIRKAGLLEKIEGGTTVSHMKVAGDKLGDLR